MHMSRKGACNALITFSLFSLSYITPCLLRIRICLNQNKWCFCLFSYTHHITAFLVNDQASRNIQYVLLCCPFFHFMSMLAFPPYNKYSYIGHREGTFYIALCYSNKQLVLLLHIDCCCISQMTYYSRHSFNFLAYDSFYPLS